MSDVISTCHASSFRFLISASPSRHRLTRRALRRPPPPRMRCFVEPDDKYVIVEMPSAYFNVLNFILFDIFLASFVFYLTADIAGLVNAASALQQLGNRLHAYNPPIVGVGLTCTRRNVFRVLAATRAVAMIGVLATNFLVEGVSCERVKSVEQSVVVPGPIDADMLQVDVRRLTLLRRGCQGRFRDTVYYGELRLGQRCELRRQLFNTETVYFGLEFVNRTIEFPTRACEFYTDEKAYGHIHRYSCSGLGTIGCMIGVDDGKSLPETCEGMVLADDAREGKKGKVAYMCSGEALFPGRFGVSRNTSVARCRMAEYANTTDTTWVPLLHNRARTLRDSIDAYYGGGVRKLQVRVTDPNDRIEVAQVEKAWFYILGVKLFIIFVLVVIDLWMRSRGLVPAANNEFGLGSLLAQSASNGMQFDVDDMPDDDDDDDDDGRAGRKLQLLLQNEHGVLRARSVAR